MARPFPRPVALVPALLLLTLPAGCAQPGTGDTAPTAPSASSASPTPRTPAPASSVAERPQDEGHDEADIAFAQKAVPVMAHHLALRAELAAMDGMDMRVVNFADEPLLERRTEIAELNAALAAWGQAPVDPGADPLPEETAALADLDGFDGSEAYLRAARANNDRLRALVEPYLAAGRNSALLTRADRMKVALDREDADIASLLATY